MNVTSYLHGIGVGLAILLLSAFILTGCTGAGALDQMLTGGQITEQTTTAAARVIDTHCTVNGFDLVGRKAMLDRVNAKTTVGDLTMLDCNSDGEPDGLPE